MTCLKHYKREFERIVDDLDLEPQAHVLADKGYSSRKNREHLEKSGYQDCIMSKALRGRPLTEVEKQRNKQISEFRYVVEQGFGM